MESDAEERDAAKVALDHAWAWFSLHATQRLQSVNFFLVAIAFLSAAFVTAAKEKMYELASGIAGLAIFTTYFFYRIERRIRYLLHAGEDVIKPLEERLARTLKLEKLCIAAIVEGERPGEWKYSKVFRYLYATTGAAFVLGFLDVVWAAASSTGATPEFKLVLQAVIGMMLIGFGYEMAVGLPIISRSDGVQAAARWSLLALGVLAILAGLGVICHLVFVRM